MPGLLNLAMRLGTSTDCMWAVVLKNGPKPRERLCSLFPLTFCLGNKVLRCSQKSCSQDFILVTKAHPARWDVHQIRFVSGLIFYLQKERWMRADVSLWMNPPQASRLGSRSYHRGSFLCDQLDIGYSDRWHPHSQNKVKMYPIDPLTTSDFLKKCSEVREGFYNVECSPFPSA